MKKLQTLNIAHIVYSFDYGGLERRILRLIDALADEHCHFSIVSLRPSDGRFIPPEYPVKHHILNAKPGIDFGAVFRLTKFLRENNIHVVHSHNWVSMLEGILAGRLARIPVVVHGEHGASRFEPNQLKWQRTLAQKFLAQLADQVIPVNRAITERLFDVWGIAANKVCPIQNGVDTDLYKPQITGETNEIVVGSISRMHSIKNFPCLIRAVSHLNEQQQKYRLIIVGDGPERDKLVALVSKLGAENFVDFPGATDNAHDWYKCFNIYVNCSFTEGMSNTVLEAMACGLPIVATDVAGHRDWLENRKHALFFESDDSLNLATKIGDFGREPNLRQRIGANNRAYVECNFSQKRFITNYVELYRKLLASKGYEYGPGFKDTA